MVRGASGVCCLLLDRDLRIRAASKDYERVTLRERGELPGQYLFDAFPDNPKDPHADGTAKLASSLETAMESGHPHTMRMQRYDIPDPGAPDEFLPKVWSPTNSPLLDHGELVGVVQAKGMLMERFDIDADRAFGLLTRLSQETNTRVEEIARNLVQRERPPRSG